MENLLLINPFFKSPILFYKELVSTMETACILSSEGYPSGTVVLAGYQQQGRGRVEGRAWIAEPGSSLLCTISLALADIRVPVQQVPIRTGVGICYFLKENWNIDAQVKWPNDVLVNGKKICGVLCESSGGLIRIGFGINCNQRSDLNYADMRIQATSIVNEARLTGSVDIPEALEKALNCIYRELFCEDLSVKWQERVLRFLYKRDEDVYIRRGAVSENKEPERLKIHGINEDGALMLEESTGKITALYSGELLYPDAEKNYKDKD